MADAPGVKKSIKRQWVAAEKQHDEAEAAQAASDEKRKVYAAEDRNERIYSEWATVERERAACNYRKELAALKLLQVLDPEDARIAPAIAEAERLVHKIERRIEFATEALRKGDHREATALVEAALLESAGSRHVSVDRILNLAAQQRDSIEPRHAEAEAAIAAERYGRAARLYREILALAPADPRALEGAAIAGAELDARNIKLIGILVGIAVAVAIAAVYLG